MLMSTMSTTNLEINELEPCELMKFPRFQSSREKESMRHVCVMYACFMRDYAYEMKVLFCIILKLNNLLSWYIYC